jgi:hypothetical protein
MDELEQFNEDFHKMKELIKQCYYEKEEIEAKIACFENSHQALIDKAESSGLKWDCYIGRWVKAESEK